MTVQKPYTPNLYTTIATNALYAQCSGGFQDLKIAMSAYDDYNNFK